MSTSKRITVTEISQELGVGRGLVIALLKKGEIPNIRLLDKPGSPFIVSRYAFERWLETAGTHPRTVLQ